MIYQFKKSEKFEKNVWSSKGLETIYGLLKAWNSVSPQQQTERHNEIYQ